MLLYFWMIVQIIGESLPISSSGHVALLQNIMMKFGDVDCTNFENLWAFDYLLQGISAIIFLLYFFPYWWQLIVNKPIKISSLCDRNLWMHNILPVFIFGFVADSMTFLLWGCHIADYIQIPLACGFMITAGALWSMHYAHENKDVKIWSWKNALLVGLVQGCALLPGISRFGTTVATLQWLGYSGRLAFSISFLLQWPLIVAGSVAGLYSLHDQSIVQTMVTVPFLMTMMIAGCVGYLVLYGIEKMIDKNILWKFSYYMIIPICLSILL